MRILIFGGTGQLGAAIARTAHGRGHAVTCLARGTSPAPGGVRFVRADRDQPRAYDEVSAERWDAVVELSSQPGQVREALAAINTAHVVYLSSVSVYRHSDVPDRQESAETWAPLAADQFTDMSQYGAAKVACEAAVTRAQGELATVIRPGLISGADDRTGRSGYYPWRFAHPMGEKVVVPGDLDFPIALLDVDDLAAWILHCLEKGVGGVFNAAGETTSLGELLELARRASGSSAGIEPVSASALLEEGVSPWMGPDSLPLWLPMPELRWGATADSSRALEAGLVRSPLSQTLQDALAFEESRGGPQGAGLSDAKERALLSR